MSAEGLMVHFNSALRATRVDVVIDATFLVDPYKKPRRMP